MYLRNKKKCVSGYYNHGFYHTVENARKIKSITSFFSFDDNFWNKGNFLMSWHFKIDWNLLVVHSHKPIVHGGLELQWLQVGGGEHNSEKTCSVSLMLSTSHNITQTHRVWTPFYKEMHECRKDS
jgi:hypothetical protein